jgi:DNA-binding response OmpR family regulator
MSEDSQEFKKRVLIVEDESFLKELLGMKFEKEGCELLYATTGEEALEVIAEKEPDVVLLDLVLPGIDGFEVLRRLSQQSQRIPVVVLSNLGQESDVQKGKKLGAIEFLIKANFSPGEVVAKVREILNSVK